MYSRPMTKRPIKNSHLTNFLKGKKRKEKMDFDLNLNTIDHGFVAQDFRTAAS